MEIRLGYYLDKRNSATVIVCKADTLDVVVNELSCIFFRKGSSEILHPAENAGNTPQRLSFGKREEASLRKLASNRCLPA